MEQLGVVRKWIVHKLVLSNYCWEKLGYVEETFCGAKKQTIGEQLPLGL